MPVYEYECQSCGKITEAWQHFSDPPLTVCEHCNGTLKKIISHSSFHLKGSGWYVTDYARKSPNCTSSKSSPAKGRDTGSAAKKSGEGSRNSKSGE